MKEYDGPMAPALPPKDGRPDFSPSVRKMLNQLVCRVRDYSKDRHRIRRIVSFKERKYETAGPSGRESRPISQVNVMDRPEVELYLYHRDVVLYLEDRAAKVKEKLDAMSPGSAEDFADLAKITTSMANIEEKRLKHITSMENILKNLSQEAISREQIMAKLAADGAKMAQAAQQHEDKMEIARKESDKPTTDDILARVAAKYNITVDEAKKYLDAKTITPEEPDVAG